MNKISDANVRRPLNRLFLKAGFEVCLFARVGNHRPCLRLHLSLPPLMAFPRDIHVLSCESAESSTIHHLPSDDASIVTEVTSSPAPAQS